MRILVLLAVGCLCCLVGGRVPLADQRIALVIGNGRYETAPLPNPTNDARLVAATLKGLGFVVLTHTDLDQTAMKRAVQDFGRRLERAGREAVGLFYFAGHGVQVNGINYLVPLGAVLEREADADIEAVNANWVLQQMEYAGNRVNVVILDACRNNPLTRRFRSGTRGLARMDAPRGTLIAYSTAPGEVAADGAGANSPYTKALAREMQVPGLPVETMFRRVRVSVMRETEDRQVPWEASSLTGEFLFTPGAPAAPQPAAAAPPADRGLELSFWNSIQGSRNRADFEAYLAQFPDGAFAALARNRLAELAPPAAPARPAAPESAVPKAAALAPAPDSRDGVWTGETPTWQLRLEIRGERVRGTIRCHRLDIWDNLSGSISPTGEIDIWFGNGLLRYSERHRGFTRIQIRGRLPEARVLSVGDCADERISLIRQAPP